MDHISNDLDIHHYNINELVRLLELPVPFTTADVHSVIQTTLQHFNETGQDELAEFFELAQKKLFLFLDNHQESIHTHPTYTEHDDDDIEDEEDTNEPDVHPSTKPTQFTDFSTSLLPPVVTQYDQHPVIEKTHHPTQDTFINQFPAGTMNPIHRRTTTQIVSIDTLFRSQYDMTSPTDFLYSFPIQMNHVISMRLCAVELPNVWHTFSSKKRNNEFTISTFNATTMPDTVHTVRIPDGNYTTSELIESMNNIFTNTGQGLQFMQFDINATTNKTIIRARNKTYDTGTNPYPFDILDPLYSPNFSFDIDFRLQDNVTRSLYFNMGWLLGFRSDLYSIDINNELVDNILLPTTITFQGYVESLGVFHSNDSYLFLSVDDFNKSVPSSIVSESAQSYLGDSLLGRITVSSGSNTIMLDNGYDKIFKQRDYFGPVKVKKIRVRLLDKFGTPIDLLNNDYSFALEFTQLYL